jgi:hypothetical protein
MFQEVSFHPEERRRVKGILKTIGSDYWCVMESSQRERAGQEDCKAGASTKNFEAPWVYAVVNFLHKDVFKQPTHLDWAAQYSNKAMRHMLQGRMSCLWAPRHSESPMLVINIHQAGSATLELQERMWMAMQGIRARYPDIQFRACVAAIKGVTASPLTPSWIDASSGKGARLDHLVGLGVEFTCASGAAAWVGTPFHDHARVSRLR